MALTGIAVLTLVSAVLFQNPGAAFRTSAALFDGHDFWSQFNHGFKELEHALNRETERMDEEMTKLYLGSKDREPLGDDEDEDDDEEEISHHGIPGIFFSMGGASTKPWWKGPNVCVEREEIDSSPKHNETEATSEDEDDSSVSFRFTTYEQTSTKYICTTNVGQHGLLKTFVVTYQCCHGYLRVAGKPGEEEPGCTEVHLKNLMETAEEVGAKDFVQLVHTSGLDDMITAQNMTLFVPSDDAVRDFTDSLQEANQVEFYVPPASARRRRRSTEMQGVSMRDIVLGHIVPGFHDMTEISNEQILQSENAHSPVRLNIYPGPAQRLLTANCARVTSVNNYATNGIVHVVDRVIRPVSKTVAELISQDEQFGIISTLLKKAGLMDKLQEPGDFTLFAPTDSAFEKLEPAVRSRLLQGEACVANVLKHHMLSHALCSAAIQARVIALNMDGDTLRLERNPDDGKLFVSGVQIVAKDVLGTNGIVHVVDEVLMSESARPVTRVLTAHNLTTFLSLIKEAGLSESLDAMSNVTLFAPTDAALAGPEVVEMLDELRGDKDKLRDLLLYHTTGPEVQSCDFANEKMLKSGLADKSIRLNLYATMPFFTGANARATAQCARILNYDNRACSGVVHIVDKLLVPPNSSVLEVIDKGENYTLLRKMIKGTPLEESLASEGPITFLAPTDGAFHKLDEEDVKILMEDKRMANRVLQQHILSEALCCAGVGATSWPFTNRVETMTGRSVAVRRDHEGRVHVGSTTVLECDMPATNGVVHAVNRVMLPHENRRNGLQHFTNPNVEVFLYGL